MKRIVMIAGIFAGVASAQPGIAQAPASSAATAPNAEINPDVGVPVWPGDIKDRPYTVVGEVKVGVRKATVFSKEASQAKIYQIIWKHAKELGADAVINAKYGDSHMTMMSWGSTTATGTAVKFSAPVVAN